MVDQGAENSSLHQPSHPSPPLPHSQHHCDVMHVCVCMYVVCACGGEGDEWISIQVMCPPHAVTMDTPTHIIPVLSLRLVFSTEQVTSWKRLIERASTSHELGVAVLLSNLAPWAGSWVSRSHITVPMSSTQEKVKPCVPDRTANHHQHTSCCCSLQTTPQHGS